MKSFTTGKCHFWMGNIFVGREEQANIPLHDMIIPYWISQMFLKHADMSYLSYLVYILNLLYIVFEGVMSSPKFNNQAFINDQSRVCWFKVTRCFMVRLNKRVPESTRDLVVNSKLSPWNGCTGLRHLNSVH